MSFSAPAILQDKWHLFVRYGATQSCVYQSMENTQYNPSNGSVIKPISSSHSIEIVFDEINALLVDGSTIQVIDRVAIMPAMGLPVAPKINDLIVDPSLVEWEVKDVVKDPMSAHYELRVRPIKQ